MCSACAPDLLQQQPKLIGLGSVTIPLGRTVQRDLANLYELDGTSPEQAALEGLQLLIESRLDRMERRSDRFDQQLADARMATTLQGVRRVIGGENQQEGMGCEGPTTMTTSDGSP